MIYFLFWVSTWFYESVVCSNGIFGDFDLEHFGFNYIEALAVLRKR
jgi:hypothetical protein